MNLTNLQARVRQVLHDDAKVFVTDPNITDWANDGQLDLATRLRLIGQETASTWGATYQLALPADFLEIERLNITYTTNENDVAWVDDQVFQSWIENTGSQPHRRIGRIYGSNIEVYPTPANGTAYTLRYFRAPAVLAAGGDVPEIPTALHVRLIQYCRAQGKYVLGEDSEGDRYTALYEQGLPGSVLGRTRFLPGPMNLRIDPGPFDLNESAHI